MTRLLNTLVYLAIINIMWYHDGHLERKFVSFGRSFGHRLRMRILAELVEFPCRSWELWNIGDTWVSKFGKFHSFLLENVLVTEKRNSFHEKLCYNIRVVLTIRLSRKTCNACLKIISGGSRVDFSLFYHSWQPIYTKFILWKFSFHRNF